MEKQQNWSTEFYKGMDVHVTTLQREDGLHWDYTVRVSEPDADATTQSELIAESGDDAEYDSAEGALQAGFARGYAMVDQIEQP